MIDKKVPEITTLKSQTTINGNISRYICTRPSERMARCFCGFETFSHPELPYFEEHLMREKDGFYCGCKGWD